MIISNEALEKDILEILRDRYNLDLIDATHLVNNSMFLEKVLDAMYEAQHNAIAWHLIKAGYNDR